MLFAAPVVVDEVSRLIYVLRQDVFLIKEDGEENWEVSKLDQGEIKKEKLHDWNDIYQGNKDTSKYVSWSKV